MQYLIDVNLPYYFSLWKGENFIHQKDIDDEWSDEQIWNYAKINNMTIVTKDADFSNKILLSIPPPRVIHVKFGNKKLKDFFFIINKNWKEIQEFSITYKLVNVFEDRIECIN